VIQEPPREGHTAADGLVIVDKPAGWTSHDVVARIRRVAGTRRVGHAGTLDPMATGVLVIGVGKATRLLGHLALTEKEYTATIRLGQATNTDDADGEIVATASAAGIEDSELEAAVAALTGEIQQVPPGFSAIKVAGQRSYRMARAGAAPELAARTVIVRTFTILAVRRPPGDPAAHSAPPGDPAASPAPPGDPATPSALPGDPAAPPAPPGDPAARPAPPGAGLVDVDVTVTCSSGTYIRALARDLGAALGVGGHLTALRRTRSGHYTVAVARTLDQLATSFEVIPLADAAAAAFPRRDLSEEEAQRVAHGGRLPLTAAGSGPVAAFAPDGSLVALLADEAGQARPLAVFAG
jgi:tRNA pseudouridine55 synthase